MKIVIVGSIEISDKIIDVSDQLEKMGHQTEIPHTTNRIKCGEITLEEFKKQKKEDGGDFKFRQESKVDYIKRHYDLIGDSDAILVLNFDKNGIKNYIGGNALIELGFAYVLGKAIYLYNDIPRMPYSDEIKGVRPVVIGRDLSRIVLRHKKCDHTSVGMIAEKGGKILLIERQKYPFGFAAPGGHVDSDNTYEAAANREFEEETGLKAVKLELLAKKRKNNPCRREGGTYHNWRVYKVEAEGNLKRNFDEVKQIGWYGKKEVAKLAKKTEKYLAGETTESAWQKSPGLEPVWYEWLGEIKDSW